MSRKLSLGEIVAKFLLNTCRLCPPSRSRRSVDAAAWSSGFATLISNDTDAVWIPLATGSVAEFYIEPMLPHLGDIDVMIHLNSLLAIPRGHPPPTQLPAEFYNYVKVLEIIDSHLPGYVYLELRYLLTECSDDDKYNVVEYDKWLYLPNHSHSFYRTDSDIHGPATTIPGIHDAHETLSLPCDIVRCVRCLSWPSQAAGWPTRHRNYSRPDSATVDRVVSNGCDVVGVAHRQCKQDEWMSENQWRLSFSRAEIALINSWMPVQQIAYHMLRVYAKSVQLTKSADNSEALSNYHIKSLILWACELKPRSWWTDVNLVMICAQLLHDLAERLTCGQCPHYFVQNCDLIDNSFNVANIRDQLTSTDETWLSTWFADNYVRKCSQLVDCPQDVSRLFDDATTSVKLQNAVSALVDWRQNRSVVDSWAAFDAAEICIPSIVYKRPLTARSCVCWMTEW